MLFKKRKETLEFEYGPWRKNVWYFRNNSSFTASTRLSDNDIKWLMKNKELFMVSADDGVTHMDLSEVVMVHAGLPLEES